MPFSFEKTEHVRQVESLLRRDRNIRTPLVQVADRQWTTSIACPSRPASLLPGTRGHHQDTPADLALEDTEAGRTSNDLIRQQLSRMLDSSTFVQSEKLSRFLRFVVEHVIDGNPGSLKEYVIGVEVYDRKPPYHPSLDSIVRTEARRLRGKLKEYYQGEGQEDPVYIYLRPGSYIPVFQHRKDLIGTRGTALAEATTLDKPSSVAIAILPFRDISENSLSMTFARGIPDELGYALMKTSGCTVVSPSILARGNNQEHDIGGAMSQFKAQIAYEGSVRTQGTRLRVTARILDATGLQLWVKRVDADTESDTHFALEEQIASALTVGFHILFGHTLQAEA